VIAPKDFDTILQAARLASTSFNVGFDLLRDDLALFDRASG